MKNPAARHMQRGSENQSGRNDSTTLEHLSAIDRDTSTGAQLRRILESLRLSPKTTDQLRALGVYQVSARIFGLRALGHSITTELFDGYAADGMHHARMARYTLNEHAQDLAEATADAAPSAGEDRND